MSDRFQGDEVRRALADRLAVGIRQNCTAFALNHAECHLVIAALRAEPVRAVEERIAFLLREAEPTLSRHGDEIILQCPDGTITDDLYDALEAAICPLPTQPAAEGGAE